MQAPVQRPLVSDYSAKHFQGVSVPLFMLYRHHGETGGAQVMQGRNFTNCTLEGPAILLALGGVTLDGCDLGNAAGDMKNLLMKPLGGMITGAVPVANFTFRNCQFIGVGFTGDDAFLQHMQSVAV